jgi:hypothetical protein
MSGPEQESRKKSAGKTGKNPWEYFIYSIRPHAEDCFNYKNVAYCMRYA